MDSDFLRSVYAGTRVDCTYVPVSHSYCREARAVSSAAAADHRYLVGFDDKRWAATLAACANGGRRDYARDTGDRCPGDQCSHRWSCGRHDALQVAYAGVGSAVLGTIRRRRAVEPHCACWINANTRNHSALQWGSYAAGPHHFPTSCKRGSRPVWRCNDFVPTLFDATRKMKNAPPGALSPGRHCAAALTLPRPSQASVNCAKNED